MLVMCVFQVGCTYTPVPSKPASTTITIKPEDVAAAMKDALAAAGLSEEEAKQEQQQHQKLTQQSRMRQGLFGGGLPKLPFQKHAAAADTAAVSTAAAAKPAVAAVAAAPAPAPVPAAGDVSADPLAITHKAEFNVTSGGKLVGKVVVGLFGNIAPKTVQNVSVCVCVGGCVCALWVVKVVAACSVCETVCASGSGANGLTLLLLLLLLPRQSLCLQYVSICKGAKGINYKGTQFHRVIKDFSKFHRLWLHASQKCATQRRVGHTGCVGTPTAQLACA